MPCLLYTRMLPERSCPRGLWPDPVETVTGFPTIWQATSCLGGEGNLGGRPPQSGSVRSGRQTMSHRATDDLATAQSRGAGIRDSTFKWPNSKRAREASKPRFGANKGRYLSLWAAERGMR